MFLDGIEREYWSCAQRWLDEVDDLRKALTYQMETEAWTSMKWQKATDRSAEKKAMSVFGR